MKRKRKIRKDLKVMCLIGAISMALALGYDLCKTIFFPKQATSIEKVTKRQK